MAPIRHVFAVVLMVCAALLALGTPPADATGDETVTRAAACGSGQVTVVVDFGSTSRTGCATNPSNGLDALGKADFSVGFVRGQPGFVCVIASVPNPCNGAPANAHWSYWHAPAGGSWSYSNSGAGARKPPAGSVEGWAFGATAAPRTSPPAPPATAPPSPPPPTTRPPRPTPAPAPPKGGTNAPTAPAPNDPGGGTPDRGEPADPSSPPEAGAEDTPTNSDTADADSSTTTDTTTATTRSGEAKPKPDKGEKDAERKRGDGPTGDAELAAADSSESRSGATTGVIGLLVVVAIVGAAIWEVRRRNRSAP